MFLKAVQRPDGGWSDIASMESGAFTTGLAMMALSLATPRPPAARTTAGAPAQQ